MSKKEKDAVKKTKEEKKAEKAAAKAEKKANKTPMAPETKQVWIKAATAVACTIAICVSGSVAANKIADNVKSAGKANPSGGTVVTEDETTTPSGDVTVVDPSTGETVPAEESTTAAGDVNNNNPGTPATTKAGGSTAADPTKYSVAETVAYYNKCLKDSYAKKVTVKKTETINIKVDKATGGDIVKNFVNDTILPKYAGTKTYNKTFTNGKSADNETITSFASPTQLVADGAASASVTKNGSNYVITIKTKAETSTLETPPKYNKMCSHPLDLATVDISPAQVTKADFTYPGTTLKATVDSTGKVLATSINQPLSGTGEGKLLVTLSATLSGSLEQSCTYTY